MGLRLRLKATFDVSQFTGPAAVILTAMQQYGLILADNGSNWFISGDSDDGWIPLMDGVTAAFGLVHGSDFEAVQTGAIQNWSRRRPGRRLIPAGVQGGQLVVHRRDRRLPRRLGIRGHDDDDHVSGRGFGIARFTVLRRS